jgi:hypothetical protein
MFPSVKALLLRNVSAAPVGQASACLLLTSFHRPQKTKEDMLKPVLPNTSKYYTALQPAVCEWWDPV